MAKKTIVKLNGKISLDADALTKHSILIGSTGSGKTTTLNVILRDLVRYDALGDSKIGLLIFDFKEDGTLQKIKEWAKECGRADDVVDFSAGGSFYFDIFETLDTFEKVGAMVDLLMAVVSQVDENNPYWHNALSKRFSTILQYLLFEEEISYAKFCDTFQSFFVGAGMFFTKIRNARESAKTMLAENPKCPMERNEYEKIITIRNKLLAQFDEWERLDGRTKSNEVSTASNFFDAISSPSIMRYLQPTQGKTPLDLHCIADGKIVVVTVPSSTEKTLASVIGKILKAELYSIIHSRQVSFSDNSRLIGIIMDEFPLCVTKGNNIASDSFNLQSIRSKKAFVIAATQGLVGLDCVIGTRERTLLMSNINNYFVFRSNEYEVQNFCEKNFAPPSNIGIIGFTGNSKTVNCKSKDCGGTYSVDKLPVGHAFIKLANGYQSSGAEKMKRLFLETKVEPRQNSNNMQKHCLQKVLKKSRNAEFPDIF